MRGAGKSYIGHMAASELGWEYLDADTFLEQRHGMTCKEYVHQNGWEAFRKTETAILSELLELKAEKTIISLGGGIVETPSARDVLKEYKARRGPIVHISRDIKEIVHYLTEEAERPAYGEEIEEVYNRRRPWFYECSSHEFVSLTKIDDGEGRKNKTKTQAAVRTFFGHITGLIPNLVNLDNDRKSYFLSLTFPDIATQRLLLDDSLGDAAVLAGIDAVELRVDLLSPVVRSKSQMLLQSNTSPNNSRYLGISQTCQSSILSELLVKGVLSLMDRRITSSVYWTAAFDLARSTSTWKPLYRMGGFKS
jgi:pentafunctional AROM polypeptide